MSWGVALMWGTVIVAVVLGGARRSLLSDPQFCVWLNRLRQFPISRHEKMAPVTGPFLTSHPSDGNA